MYCPKCKFTSDKFVNFCPTCGQPLVHPKIARLAIWSLILGILGLVLFQEHYWGITSIAAVVLGIIALINLRKNKTLYGKKLCYAGISIGAITLLLLPCFYWINTPSYKAQNILKNARLAPLPKSATDIEVEGWSGMFTGEDYVIFYADPCDIEVFINTSPSLKNVSPEKSPHRRNYSIPPYENHNWGTLEIDDRAHTVSLKLVWS